MAIELARIETNKTECVLVGQLLAMRADPDLIWDLNPPFQRGSVWTIEQKQLWWETIINDYPSPAIFINRFPFDGCQDPKWRGKEIVIDGKQRIEAILGFIDGEFTVRGETWEQQSGTFKRIIKNTWHCPVVYTHFPTMKECCELYLKLLKTGTAHSDDEIAKAEQILHEFKESA